MYNIAIGFGKLASGPFTTWSGGGAGISILGSAVVIPPRPVAQQIDHAIFDADLFQAPGMGANFRLSVVKGPVSADNLVSAANLIPDTFAVTTPAPGGGSAVTFVLQLADALPNLEAMADLQPIGYSDDRHQPFSARPGGGLVLLPNESALVLFTAMNNSGEASWVSGEPYARLTVCGGPLPPDVAAALGADLRGYGPARFGNTVQAGAPLAG